MKAEGPASSRGPSDLRKTKGNLWGECPVSRHERLDSHSRLLQGLDGAGEASYSGQIPEKVPGVAETGSARPGELQ